MSAISICGECEACCSNQLGADGRATIPGWRNFTVYRQSGLVVLPLALNSNEGSGLAVCE
jgi:hypothetical protein